MPILRNKPLNLLIVARNCPYPSDNGEKVRVYNILKELSKKYGITLVYRRMFEYEKDSKEELLQFCDEVIDVYVPPPKSHFQRFIMICDILRRGYPLICAPYYFPAIATPLAEITKNQAFDAVQIEHSLLFPYLDSMHLKNGCLKLVTIHNIDFIRFKRLLEQIPLSLRKFFYYAVTGRLKSIELNSLKRFDYILTMSEKDNELFAYHGFKGRMISVPNGVDTEAISPATSPTSKKNIVFVGSLDYEANRDGVLWFLKEIWPKVSSALPEARLILVGRNPSGEIRAHQSNRITATGTIEIVEPYYRHARVCIVPLRAGGGTRLKVLEGLAYGVPIVSTTVGCEGITVENKKNIIIADSPEDFANGIIKIFSNDNFWQSISLRGRSLVEERYSWKKVIKGYDEIL